jgi:hypothetical protein
MKSALVAFPKLKVEKRLEALLKAKTFASSRAWPTISNASSESAAPSPTGSR